MKSTKIIYSIQGEGRGHAGRSLRLLEKMQEDGFKIWVFSGGDALSILENKFFVFKIPVFRLHYGKNGISMVATFLKNSYQALGLIFGIGQRYHRILRQVKTIRPDFIISDFEPYLNRIGCRLKIPVISIDHQRVLIDSEIPKSNWIIKYVKLPIYRLFIHLLFSQSEKVIVSSFFHFPKKKSSQASFVGPFIPASLYQKTPVRGNRITVYLKEPQYLHLLLLTLTSMQEFNFDIFSHWPRSIKNNADQGHIHLHPIDRDCFLSALVNSMALITTAGNQVIGEAIFLKKPVLAFPKLNDTEQKINALALALSGFGACCDLTDLNPQIMRNFIQRLSFYRKNIESAIVDREKYDGTHETLKIIRASARQFSYSNSRQRRLYPQHWQRRINLPGVKLNF